jgi:pentatricopeptide repeat protein
VGNGFGEKLRAERLERGLTQAELGKDLYSPSYISLLETGRREPTAEVIEELARRLELAPKALEAWSHPVSVSDAEYVLAGLYARQAWDLRDYPLAASHAAAAAQIALEARNTSAWWNMTYMQAECVMKQGQLKECQKIIQHLLEHPMATESAGLGVRARQMLAAVCHGQGQLATAVEHATEAVQLSLQLPRGSTLIIGAHRALIGALAESGKLDEAWKYCESMMAQMDEHSMSQLAGEVAWVVGNVAFMRHDYAEGKAPLPRERHRTLGTFQQGLGSRAFVLRNRGARNALGDRARGTGPLDRGRQQDRPAGSGVHPGALALPHG